MDNFKVKDLFNSYRERACKIENKVIQIENLLINGANKEDKQIKNLEIQMKKMELENKKIDNILKLLPDKELEVINLIYLKGKEKKIVSRELDRTERQLNYTINKAIKLIAKNLRD